MSNHVSQEKLEQVLLAIWGGKQPHHWQLVANMLYAYTLLFKGSDDNKFMQCMCLFQVATIHANSIPHGELELAA